MRRWRVYGPCFADGWWYVDDSRSTYPELRRLWFDRRAAARAYAARKNRGGGS